MERKKGRKTLWKVVGGALAALAAVAIAWLVKEANEPEPIAMPMYGVFSVTPAIPAYAGSVRLTQLLRLVGNMARAIARFALNTASLVVGTCIYAARKISRR